MRRNEGIKKGLRERERRELLLTSFSSHFSSSFLLNPIFSSLPILFFLVPLPITFPQLLLHFLKNYPKSLPFLVPFSIILSFSFLIFPFFIPKISYFILSLPIFSPFSFPISSPKNTNNFHISVCHSIFQIIMLFLTLIIFNIFFFKIIALSLF